MTGAALCRWDTGVFHLGVPQRLNKLIPASLQTLFYSLEPHWETGYLVVVYSVNPNKAKPELATFLRPFPAKIPQNSIIFIIIVLKYNEMPFSFRASSVQFLGK